MTFHLMGGVNAKGLKNVQIVIDGTLKFSDKISKWKRKENGEVEECIYIERWVPLTLNTGHRTPGAEL